MIVVERHVTISHYIMGRQSYPNAMKNKIYHNLRTVQKSNRKITETQNQYPLHTCTGLKVGFVTQDPIGS